MATTLPPTEERRTGEQRLLTLLAQNHMRPQFEHRLKQLRRRIAGRHRSAPPGAALPAPN